MKSGLQLMQLIAQICDYLKHLVTNFIITILKHILNCLGALKVTKAMNGPIQENWEHSECAITQESWRYELKLKHNFFLPDKYLTNPRTCFLQYTYDFLLWQPMQLSLLLSAAVVIYKFWHICRFRICRHCEGMYFHWRLSIDGLRDLHPKSIKIAHKKYQFTVKDFRASDIALRLEILSALKQMLDCSQPIIV